MIQVNCTDKAFELLAKVLKNHIGLIILSSAAALSYTCFSSCLLKALLWNAWSPLIGQLTHAWPSTPNDNHNNRPTSRKAWIMQMCDSVM